MKKQASSYKVKEVMRNYNSVWWNVKICPTKGRFPFDEFVRTKRNFRVYACVVQFECITSFAVTVFSSEKGSMNGFYFFAAKKGASQLESWTSITWHPLTRQLNQILADNLPLELKAFSFACSWFEDDAPANS